MNGIELDKIGMTKEHSRLMWYPYLVVIKGEDYETEHPALFCHAIPFFRTEETDYKKLLKECLTSLRCYEPEKVKEALNPGFEYLSVDYDSWEEKEADNEFFRKLFWSVYLHINNRANKEDYDTWDDETETRFHKNDFYELISVDMEFILAKHNLGFTTCRYNDTGDFLPACLSAFGI